MDRLVVREVIKNVKMDREVKELRVNIDRLAQLTKSLKPCKDIIKGISSVTGDPVTFNGWYDKQSKELEKATDSLYLAKAWLGKVLAELGENTPYANDGKRTDVKDIEPAADIAKNLTVDVDGGWYEMIYIEKVDWLRQEIEKVVLGFLNIELADLENKISRYLINNIKTYLHEARFWLGFELGRLRDEK